MRRHIPRADFPAVKADEKVDVEIPVVVVGEFTPGTVHFVEEFTILVKAPTISILESLKVSIEGVETGSAVHVPDLLPPAGVEVELDPEAVVATVQEAAPEEIKKATEEAAAEGDAESDAE